MDEIFGLFPTPFLRVPAALGGDLVNGLVAHFSALAVQDNSSSDHLTHTQMLKPATARCWSTWRTVSPPSWPTSGR